MFLLLKKKSALKLSDRTVYIGRLGENRFMSSTGAQRFLNSFLNFWQICAPLM